MSVLLANLEASPPRAATTVNLSENFRDDDNEAAATHLWHAAPNGAYATAI